MTVVAILSSAQAHAELIASGGPRHAFVAATRPGFERALRLDLMAAPTFSPMLVSVIGLWRPDSFVLNAPAGLTASPEAQKVALCLGVSCSGVVGGDVDPRTATPSASTAVINSIPIGRKALALFADPVPKRDQKVAWSVVPMFAMGGAGIEMRLAWW